MQIVRLQMSWGQNLYRFSQDGRVEAFNKDPEARAILGRWSDCPNINVAKAIFG